jgi:hypothetical protein
LAANHTLDLSGGQRHMAEGAQRTAGAKPALVAMPELGETGKLAAPAPE